MKTLLSVLLILLALVFAGCNRNAQGSPLSAGGNNNSTQTRTQTEKLMDAAELRAIAYAYAGVAENDVYDVDDDWEKRADTTVYELDFEAFGVEYEYGLNGYTGKVMYSTSEGTPEYPDVEAAAPVEITEAEAKAIALTHAGLTEENVVGLRVELDREDRDYEIEFYADGIEYDYEIDLYTGQILKAEKDRD